MVDQVQTVVVGAGVVGLAVARALAQSGREVIVLEAADAIGTGTSSRNSEVIHAGIYYPKDSLKARLCVQGKELLYAYCAEKNVEHRRCGKLIVATSGEQVAQLQQIQQKQRPMACMTCNSSRATRRRRWSLHCNARQRCFHPAPALWTAMG